MTERTKGHIRLDSLDLWTLQNLIKPTAMWYVPTMFGPPHVYEFRKVINTALLRLEDEKLSSIEIPISEIDAWIIDSALSKDTYSNARNVLVQVYRVIWELDYDLLSQEYAPQDTPFSPKMLEGFQG